MSGDRVTQELSHLPHSYQVSHIRVATSDAARCSVIPTPDLYPPYSLFNTMVDFHSPAVLAADGCAYAFAAVSGV